MTSILYSCVGCRLGTQRQQLTHLLASHVSTRSWQGTEGGYLGPRRSFKDLQECMDKSAWTRDPEWHRLGDKSAAFAWVACQRTLSVTVSCGVVKKAFSPARQA